MKVINLRSIFFFIIFSLFLNLTSYSAQPEWTVMVYLCADNNLEPDSIDDVDEMESVFSQVIGVEVIVLWDRAEGHSTGDGDWKGTRLYKIKSDSTKGECKSELLADWGEKNMGDPQTLKDFLVYCADNYLGKQNMLIMWDHGSGWLRSRETIKNKAICSDDLSNDHLNMFELQQGLSVFKARTAKKIDIIGFDACLMQLIEVGLTISDYADYMVGSEQTEPGGGWPYDKVIPQFYINKDSKDKICTNIVDEYIKSYDGMPGCWNVTLSTIDLNQLLDVTLSMKELNYALYTNMPRIFRDFKKAYGSATYFYYDFYVDLYHFLTLLHENVNDNEIKRLTKTVIDKVYSAIKYNKVTKNNIITPSEIKMDYASGMAFYAPYRTADIFSGYSQMYFASISRWDAVISRYFSIMTGSTGEIMTSQFEPVDFEIYRARKISAPSTYYGSSSNSNVYDYSKVTEEDFLHGYGIMLGKYPYTPYEDDYYQIYMSFNVDVFGYDTSSVIIDSAVLYYNGAQIRLDDKDIVGILKSSKTGNYIQDSEMDRLTGLKFTSGSISGDSFKQKISKWMKKEEV
jgi:hypothetical protein